MNSELSIKIYAMLKDGVIKSHAEFWRSIKRETVENYSVKSEYISDLTKQNINLICVFDKDFPKFNESLKPSEKPFIFAYKGDIGLIKSDENSVAVIGVISPTDEIKRREQNIVNKLIENNLTITSGLAEGCDTVAHETSLDKKGKTIAVLPTTLNNIYPKKNEFLATRIIENGGLVITEYLTEPQNRYERIKRFIFRDRLQALFSTAVILVASYCAGDGDSGSRHAMNKAKEYGKKRYVMYNEKTDCDLIFGLNKSEIKNGARIITNSAIVAMTKL